MKTVEEYMSLPYRMEIVSDSLEGGYVISYPVEKILLRQSEMVKQLKENGLLRQLNQDIRSVNLIGFHLIQDDSNSEYLKPYTENS